MRSLSLLFCAIVSGAVSANDPVPRPVELGAPLVVRYVKIDELNPGIVKIGERITQYGTRTILIGVGGKVVTRQETFILPILTIRYKASPIEDFTVWNGDGNRLTGGEALRLLRDRRTVLVTEGPLDPKYRATLPPDAIVLSRKNPNR
jgi:hypothetical protein